MKIPTVHLRLLRREDLFSELRLREVGLREMLLRERRLPVLRLRWVSLREALRLREDDRVSERPPASSFARRMETRLPFSNREPVFAAFMKAA